MAKRMTNKQRQANAQLKKKFQAEGLIPPDKPKLNRKKFIQEAREEYNGCESILKDVYLMQAISIMLDKKEGTSPEAVGVAKAIKMAVRLADFHAKLKEEGRTSYNVMEEYECIADIYDA